jgi:hypothetical protein
MKTSEAVGHPEAASSGAGAKGIIGLVDWWIGGLVDWWIGGLVDWWIGGFLG